MSCETDDPAPPPAKRQRTETPDAKPVLVVLPGSSSNLALDMKVLLLPALTEAGYDVRIRPGSDGGGKKWSGWNPGTNAKVVNNLGICPLEAGAAPWWVLGASFGSRVACSIVSDGLTPVAPGLILTGYPMYGPGGNDKEARVEHIQKLPASAKVLAISGGKDECLGKNVPDGKPRGPELWDSVVADMRCSANTTIAFNERGGHGVYESGKSAAARARNAEATANIVQWINEFTGNTHE